MATRALDAATRPDAAGQLITLPHRRRRLPVIAITVLAVLLGAEVGARALARRVPAPSGWSQGQIAITVDRMRAMAAAERGADVVFLGSSVASFDLDPATLTERTGVRSFNASLVGASAVSIEPWAREFVVPTLRPKLVVIGLASRDLNFAGIQRFYYQGYLDSPARRRALGLGGLAERIARAAEDRSALVRLRQHIRKPGSVARFLQGKGTLEEFLDLGPHGEALFPEADVAFREVPQQAQWNREALDGFSMDAGVAALRRLTASLRAQGIEVAFVETPVIEEIYTAYHPRGRDDFEAFRSGLRALGDELGVPVIAPRGRWDDTKWFVDSMHLNRAGARRYTTQVARALERLDLTR